MWAKQNGFTIVELLIVIVVIAILAAISLVAYNGIQTRAKLTQNTASMNKIGKAIQLWSAKEGSSLRDSNSGAGGAGYGGFSTSYSGLQSVETLLRDSGFLTTTVDLSAILVAACTDNANDTRWTVIAIANPDPYPTETTNDARLAAGCTSVAADLYTTGTNYTNRNFFKVY